VLATKFFGKPSVVSTRTLGRGEETQLSSGGTLKRSELSSPNFNSRVRTERSFTTHYLNVLSRRSRPKVKDASLDRAFPVALLRNLAGRNPFGLNAEKLSTDLSVIITGEKELQNVVLLHTPVSLTILIY